MVRWRVGDFFLLVSLFLFLYHFKTRLTILYIFYPKTGLRILVLKCVFFSSIFGGLNEEPFFHTFIVDIVFNLFISYYLSNSSSNFISFHINKLFYYSSSFFVVFFQRSRHIGHNAIINLNNGWAKDSTVLLSSVENPKQNNKTKNTTSRGENKWTI